MTRALPSQLAARRLAARKAKAETLPGRGRPPLRGRRTTIPPEPRRQARDLGAKFANLLTQLTELPGQVSDHGGAFSKNDRSGTDIDASARVADHQALGVELGHRRTDHGDTTLVRPTEPGGGRNGHADRQLPSGDQSPEVISHLDPRPPGPNRRQ